MKLHEFFSAGEVPRDADFAITLHPQARVSGAICYALKEAVLLKINRNPCIAAVITIDTTFEKTDYPRLQSIDDIAAFLNRGA